MADEKKTLSTQDGEDTGVEIIDNATLEVISKQVIEENLPAYKELAK